VEAIPPRHRFSEARAGAQVQPFSVTLSHQFEKLWQKMPKVVGVADMVHCQVKVV